MSVFPRMRNSEKEQIGGEAYKINSVLGSWSKMPITEVSSMHLEKCSWLRKKCVSRVKNYWSRQGYSGSDLRTMGQTNIYEDRRKKKWGDHIRAWEIADSMRGSRGSQCHGKDVLEPTEGDYGFHIIFELRIWKSSWETWIRTVAIEWWSSHGASAGVRIEFCYPLRYKQALQPWSGEYDLI